MITKLPIDQLLPLIQQVFAAGTIGSGRLLGLIIYFPLFSYLQLKNSVLRLGVAIGLSVPSIAIVYHDMALTAPMPYFQIIALMMKEMAVGGVLGMLLGLPFWAAQTAGDVTDAFRGAS